jgi:hypothetical protein
MIYFFCYHLSKYFETFLFLSLVQNQSVGCLSKCLFRFQAFFSMSHGAEPSIIVLEVLSFRESDTCDGSLIFRSRYFSLEFLPWCVSSVPESASALDASCFETSCFAGHA